MSARTLSSKDPHNSVGVPAYKNPCRPDFWAMKIAALTHDPPMKPWVKNHYDVAADLLPDQVKVLGEVAVERLVRRHHVPDSEKTPFERILAFADWCSSAVERPLAGLVGEIKEVGFIHPLSGLELGEKYPQVVRKIPEERTNEIGERIKEGLQRLIKNLGVGPVLSECAKEVYLVFWRTLEGVWWKAAKEVLGEDEARRLIPPPADTRTPMHTVFDHAESTSALTPCASIEWTEEGKPREVLDAALVSFDIGGVQPLISTSRRTSDLWAGSWLISLLSWCALREACELLGPDAVVFPYLKGMPFVDAWIASKVASAGLDPSSLMREVWGIEEVTEEEWLG
ncbi:MAG: hypothetical protein N3H31_07980, partial [Candidatus Nezhaarchaeota archaeon]|nr:hypothetical protein [Candidatus Nezhaarchaeota archaeon]